MESNSNFLFLKIMVGDWINQSRDEREISVVSKLGARVIVLAKSEQSSEQCSDTLRTTAEGYKVLSASTRPFGGFVPKTINRFLALFIWARLARKLKPNVISGHDLPGLFIGYISMLFLPKSRKASLIYDSHEFELGRNTKRNKVSTWAVCGLERFLMRQCDFSMMVNDSIADEVQRIHHLTQRPVVVRNVPPYWILDEKKTKLIRTKLCGELNVSEDMFLAMYHGGILHYRGIEQFLQAVAKTKNTAAVILGNGEESYVQSLQQLANGLNIAHRVLFHSAVSFSELPSFVAAVDVGVGFINPTCRSYYFALPNKLFENIQGLTPLIVSNLPEMASVINHYQIGLAVDFGSVDALACAIERMKSDTIFYRTCKENLIQAKRELCWENELKVLEAAYRPLLVSEGISTPVVAKKT